MEKLKKNTETIERLYFPLKTIFLTKFNTFSMFYLDFEFKKLKKSRVIVANLKPDRIYDKLQLEKTNISSKVVKLIEELLLALCGPNEFLYSQGHYQPAKLLKSMVLFIKKFLIHCVNFHLSIKLKISKFCKKGSSLNAKSNPRI